LSTTYRQMFVSRSARFLPPGRGIFFSGTVVLIAACRRGDLRSEVGLKGGQGHNNNVLHN
jgi:hypothetical protein